MAGESGHDAAGSPAIEAASPGTFERVGQRVADAVGSAKQQIFGVGAQAKQQASATYYRAVDPTPLAGVRPSAVAAMVASCLTIGGGAAAYCANQSLDPIGAVIGWSTATRSPNRTAALESACGIATNGTDDAGLRTELRIATAARQPKKRPTTTEEAPPPESPTPAETTRTEPTTRKPEAQPEGEFEPTRRSGPRTGTHTAAPDRSRTPRREPTESAKQPAPVQSSPGAGEFEP